MITPNAPKGAGGKPGDVVSRDVLHEPAPGRDDPAIARRQHDLEHAIPGWSIAQAGKAGESRSDHAANRRLTRVLRENGRLAPCVEGYHDFRKTRSGLDDQSEIVRLPVDDPRHPGGRQHDVDIGYLMSVPLMRPPTPDEDAQPTAGSDFEDLCGLSRRPRSHHELGCRHVGPQIVRGRLDVRGERLSGSGGHTFAPAPVRSKS